MYKSKVNISNKFAAGTSLRTKGTIAILACSVFLLVTFSRVAKAAAIDNASDLLKLAKEKFGSLTKAEEKLFRAVADGELADYSAKDANDNYPAKANKWDPERVFDANRIEWLCTNKEALELVTHKGILVRGLRIDEELGLMFSKIPFPLVIMDCAILSGIDLRHAKIQMLGLQGMHTGPIKADGLQAGRVFLRDGFKARGEVRLLGATIGGNLDCNRGHFINPDGRALGADGLNVDGYVFFCNGFKADGEVRLLGAIIGRDLDCGNGEFKNKGATALSADGIKVKGAVFLRNGFKAEGRVSLVSATIDQYLFWDDVDSPEKAKLDLRSARIHTLYDEKDSWPEPGKLLLHGLVYDEIHEKAPRDSKSCIAWIRLQYNEQAEKDKKQFRPQPYEQLAAVLHKSGRDADAKKILFAKNKDKARLTKLTWSEWLWYRLFGPIISYGYRPWRFLWIGLVLVLLGWLFF